MIIWIGVICATALMLAAIVTAVMAWRIQAGARRREAMADADGGVSPAEWQAARRLKRIALICLGLSLFVAACIWAVFGGAIADQMA